MKNKQGLWQFSPSGLYGYTDCKACFWRENHLARHPFTLPLRLNDAMDAKMKSRYDRYRKKGQLPPEVKKFTKGYQLFSDLKALNKWREQYLALRYINEAEGYLLRGKLDEVMVDPKGRLVPADYKSSGDPPKEDKYKYYELQLNAYGLMLVNKGYQVADEAFLLHYFPRDREDPSLLVELDFHIDKVKLDFLQFQQKMREIVKFLKKDFPGYNSECKRCNWLKQVRSLS